MIDEITVENLALISEASLEPSKGLTVLTGETGAGKTALLSAFKLLMGERADKHAVREGCEGLRVSGRFLGGPADADDLAASDLIVGDPVVTTPASEIVVTRTLSADGRSRAKANGEMLSMGELSALVSPRVDLCSQNEHQQLMRPASHAEHLDAWIGQPAREAAAAYVEAFDQAQAARAELERVLHAAREDSAAIDEARFILQRIDAVRPQEGEYEDLAESLHRAENAEALAQAAFGACEALSGENGALDGLNAAIVALQEGARYDSSLGDLAAQLSEACYILEDVARDARDYGDGIEFDPEMLASWQQRMADLQGLLRAYGPRMQDVFAARAQAADAVSLVDGADLREREARAALDRAEGQLAECAERLASMRAENAGRFAEAVTAQMRRLEMGGAELIVAQTELPRERWTRAGSVAIEFLFRPGSGLQPRPLARIASGGEVSRVMLALKVVLGEADNVETLVFDEIDAGVGGAVAHAIGDVLADLSRSHQVIVVTHLAQIAVRGDAHYIVEKTESAGLPETRLRLLRADERPAEIARMLSGEVTPTSLQHATELLAR